MTLAKCIADAGGVCAMHVAAALLRARTLHWTSRGQHAIDGEQSKKRCYSLNLI